MSLHRARLAWSLALLTLSCGACAGPAQAPAASASEAPGPAHSERELAALAERVERRRAGRAAETGPPPWAGTEALASNAGSYVIQYRPGPADIPWGEPFGMRVWVLENRFRPAPAEHVALSVDAAMPEHGHGMNRVPLVTRNADGSFEVDGLLLHMPGRWELYFDVTRGALTERAQTEVELE